MRLVNESEVVDRTRKHSFHSSDLYSVKQLLCLRYEKTVSLNSNHNNKKSKTTITNGINLRIQIFKAACKKIEIVHIFENSRCYISICEILM